MTAAQSGSRSDAGEDFTPLERALYFKARSAMARAHAPYSGFPVGAAVLTASGDVFVGANVENASYPEGWCAETSALANMVSASDDRRLVMVAVAAENLDEITPCGGCRQRLAEFGSADAAVILGDARGPTKRVTLGALLPLAFDSKALPADAENESKDTAS